MGRPWGICKATSGENTKRWMDLVVRARVGELRIPVDGEGQCLVLRGASGEIETRSVMKLDVIADIAALDTPDLTWADVDRVLGEQMVFLPYTGGKDFLYSGPGFEPNTLVGGLDRLLRRGEATALDVQLRAAGTLAAYYRLAIEVRP